MYTFAITVHIVGLRIHDRHVQFPLKGASQQCLTGEQLQGGGQRQADVGRSHRGGGALVSHHLQICVEDESPVLSGTFTKPCVIEVLCFCCKFVYNGIIIY